MKTHLIFEGLYQKPRLIYKEPLPQTMNTHLIFGQTHLNNTIRVVFGIIGILLVCLPTPVVRGIFVLDHMDSP